MMPIVDIYNRIETNDFYKLFELNVQNENGRIAFSFVNPYSSICLLEQEDASNMLSGIDHFFVDGALQVIFSNRLFNKDIKRYSFDYSSIANYVFEYCESHSLSVGLIGGNIDELTEFVRVIQSKYPRLLIKQAYSGYFDSQEDLEECLQNIDVDLLVIGMGTPLQERVSIMSKSLATRVNLVMTCGGFISQTARKKDYYHPWIKKLGIRWVQRAWLEPHYRSRLFQQYPKFVWCSLKAYLSKK